MDIQQILSKIMTPHARRRDALEFLRFIGPGLLVTVGFIDPGNWATNVAAGAEYGYSLLWVVSLSTIMLIFLQHNAAHLGIATGLCLSESAATHFRPSVSRFLLSSAVLAAVATAFAEILGASIALQMLFNIPLRIGATLVLAGIMFLVFTNSYRKIEKIIMVFVSIIGLSFLYELSLVNVDWPIAITGALTPSIPNGSMIIVMSVLGAVLMPHNLFLHSEVIQSREWNRSDKKIIEKQLRFEFLDTIFSMGIGFAINSAMIILAATTFYASGIQVTELGQAESMLAPILGSKASLIFAIALLFAGLSSSITAAMAGGSIFAGMFKEPYDIRDTHSKTGVLVTLIAATLLVYVISDPFRGLVISQMLLSIQLPLTVFTLLALTSSRKVMGEYRNHGIEKYVLWIIAVIVSILNVMLLISTIS
jgi:manganese transport protein